MTDEDVDVNSLEIKGTDKLKMLNFMYRCYGLQDDVPNEL